MDLRYVETFYRAAMLGSIAAAAAELHVVPRAASQRIRRLEIDLKATLLDRNSGKRLRLTPAGMRFFHEAERLLCLWGEIKAEMGKSVAFLRPLRVGAIESVLHSWLVPWVQTLRREKPALRFELTVETTPGLLDLMRRGMLDVVFSTDELRADGVRVRAMAPMPMVFAGGEAARRRGNYTLEQLVKLELLTFQRNSRPHTALLERLRAAGLERACVHAVSSISAMTQLAASGFGVATLPSAVLERLGSGSGVYALRCTSELDALPIHASWLIDPGTTALDTIVESALSFAGFASRTTARPSAKKVPKR